MVAIGPRRPIRSASLFHNSQLALLGSFTVENRPMKLHDIIKH